MIIYNDDLEVCNPRGSKAAKHKIDMFYYTLSNIDPKIRSKQQLHENKKFCLMKICEKDRKDHIFINFRMFPFHGNIIFSELFFKRKCKKAASFRKCVFLRKYEIFVYDSYA